MTSKQDQRRIQRAVDREVAEFNREAAKDLGKDPEDKPTSPNLLSPEEQLQVEKAWRLVGDHLLYRGKPSVPMICSLTGLHRKRIFAMRTRVLAKAGIQSGIRDGVDYTLIGEAESKKIQELIALWADTARNENSHYIQTYGKTEKIDPATIAPPDTAFGERLRQEAQFRPLTDAELDQVLSRLAVDENPTVQVNAVKALNDLRNRRRPEEKARLQAPVTDEEAADRITILLDCLPKEWRQKVFQHFDTETSAKMRGITLAD